MDAGIKGILSFSPVHLHLPKDEEAVQYVDLTSELQTLLYFMRKRGLESVSISMNKPVIGITGNETPHPDDVYDELCCQGFVEGAMKLRIPIILP